MQTTDAAMQTSFQTSFEATQEFLPPHLRMAKLMRMLSGVDAADVPALRGMIEETGGLSRAEADALIAIEAAPAPKCDDWAAFFIDALTDHIVWQSRPTGVVNESQGEWLIAMADRCNSQNALGALANVAAEAHRLPLWFVAAVRARLARSGAPVDLSLVA
jgi:hypothetical protein